MQSGSDIEKYLEMPTQKTVGGKYVVKTHLLGEGSFAKTYLAVDTEARQLLACKMISKQELINQINRYQAKTEAKDYFVKALKNQMNTWRKLKHPNIVKCIDVLETSSNIYFFLEYCEGGCLLKKMKQGNVQYAEAVKIIKEIVDGCAYLYKLNIFHRDLKPENILITQGVCKISDFGFAKATEESLKDHPEKGTVAGTPIYMSPQILRGEPYSLKCDVWSLGVIFYKLLFGFLPWDDVDDKDKLISSLNQPIKFPPSQPIPQQVKKIIEGMLTIDQANRITMANVKDMLEAVNPMEIQ